VTRSRPIVLLVVLSLIWGSSFMFIKVAVRELDPSTLILGRIGIATLTLLAVVPWLVGRDALRADVRRHWPALVAVGLLYTAVPFWLLPWAETRIDSGLASVIQASVPIFNAVLAFAFFHEERVGGARLVGVGIGFVGVAVLVGAQPHAKILGAVAVVAMALCYAVGGLLAKRHLATARPNVVALATSAVAAVAVLPAGVAQAPHHVPGWKALASVAVLGVVCTALAYLLFYTLVARAGAGYAALVTYLVPPVALAYGAVFLDEGIGVPAVVGLVLVLAGVTLGTGATRIRSRRWSRSAAPLPTTSSGSSSS
jgi:drug/metabolite transporter (DMT)-like permease